MLCNLTNIARDVVEDEKKNRVYLINYSKDKLMNIKKIIYTAETFYNSSFAGIKDIPLSCRFSIIVARRGLQTNWKKIFNIKDLSTYKKLEKFMFQILVKLYKQFFLY